jgi:hypothetical protein
VREPVISFPTASCTSKTTMEVPELIYVFYEWQGNSKRKFRTFVGATVLDVIICYLVTRLIWRIFRNFHFSFVSTVVPGVHICG